MQSEKSSPHSRPDLKVITANRLIDGAVVYMSDKTQGHTIPVWSENIACALASAQQEQQEAMLARAEQSVATDQVVGPYLIPIEHEDGRKIPVALRERIRAQGPTIRLEDNQKPLPASEV